MLSAHVNTVLKDSDGLIWIGTKQGLDRYDGYSCKHFVNEPTDPSSLPENNIRSLYDRGDGKMYIGFWGKGFSIYNKTTEHFENYQHDLLTKAPRKDTVFAFCPDKRGHIWMATDHGVDLFYPQSKQIEHFSPFASEKEKGVTSMSRDKEGNLWLYGPSYKLCKLDPNTKQFSYLSIDSLQTGAGFSHNAAVLLDREGNIWFGNEREGLCKYHLATQKLEKYRLENGLLKSDIINCLLESHDGHIWAGTEGAGLFEYDPKKNDFVKHQYIANLPNNLRSNYISCLYESHPGIIWVGSITYGLSIFKRDKIKFERFSIKGDENKRLLNPSVLSIAPAPDNKVWIGTDGGGLHLFDPATRSFEYFTKENSPLCNNSVKSIYTDEEGTLWYGTFEMGLCNANFKHNTAHNFVKDLIGKESKGIANCAWILCPTSDHRIWIGLLQGGIKIYDLQKKAFVDDLNTSPEFRKLISMRIQMIFQDSKGRIWIGTENFGLLCYFPDTKKYTHFPMVEGDSTSLRSLNIKTVFEDRQHHIWIGLQRGGLSKLIDLEKGAFHTYTILDGLPNNNVKDIVEDSHGNLWLGTEKGISCFHVKEQFFRNFDMQDGLQGANFHSNSNYLAPDGSMYFGGIDGFNVFHPDKLHFNKVPPKVLITDFKIFDQSIAPNRKQNGKIYTQKAIQYIKELQLRHSDDVFSIEFAALDFLSPHKNMYAYRLEGFNNKWIYVDAEHRSVSYTNLNPGTYTFHVIASNGDGVWNNEGTSLTIIINPPFYLTWWFRILVAVGILGFFLAFYLWRTRSIRLRNMQLKEEVEYQTKKLRDINEELQLTAEELALQNTKSRQLYEELTQSLEAAKVIQHAILPNKALLEKNLGKIDILFRPKDVVSGDFYWYNKVGDKDVIAVVDCTGHGVAGAFMTFVGYEILNQISRHHPESDPGKFLSELNQEILRSTTHYQNGNQIGMDVSMCAIDWQRGTLHFAGANNPLYIVRRGEILIFKGDKQGIGGKQKTENYVFKTHQIELEPGDQLYLFSDGYADQLGGEYGDMKFLYSRFRDLLLEISAADTQKRLQIIAEKFDGWKMQQEQLDDVLVIGFDYLPIAQLS